MCRLRLLLEQLDRGEVPQIVELRKVVRLASEALCYKETEQRYLFIMIILGSRSGRRLKAQPIKICRHRALHEWVGVSIWMRGGGLIEDTAILIYVLNPIHFVHHRVK